MATDVLRCVVAGEQGVGKTSLVACLRAAAAPSMQQPDTPAPTEQVVETAAELDVGGASVRLSVLDTGAEELLRLRFRAGQPLLAQAHAAVLVFDLCRRDTLDAALELRHACAEDTMLALVGAKADLEGERVVPLRVAELAAEQAGAQYFETSAFDDWAGSPNVRRVFAAVAAELATWPRDRLARRRRRSGSTADAAAAGAAAAGARGDVGSWPSTRDVDSPRSALSSSAGSTPSPRAYAKKGREVWVADSERAACVGCAARFGALTRRHHCRACGEVFCAQCSSHRAEFIPASRRDEAAAGQYVAKKKRLCGVCAAAADAAGEAKKGREAWVADGDRPGCVACNVQFGQLTRRHHCRSCGEVFCAKCSSHRMEYVPISRREEAEAGQYKAKKKRLCEACAAEQYAQARGKRRSRGGGVVTPLSSSSTPPRGSADAAAAAAAP